MRVKSAICPLTTDSLCFGHPPSASSCFHCATLKHFNQQIHLVLANGSPHPPPTSFVSLCDKRYWIATSLLSLLRLYLTVFLPTTWVSFSLHLVIDNLFNCPAWWCYHPLLHQAVTALQNALHMTRKQRFLLNLANDPRTLRQTAKAIFMVFISLMQKSSKQLSRNIAHFKFGQWKVKFICMSSCFLLYSHITFWWVLLYCFLPLSYFSYHANTSVLEVWSKADRSFACEGAALAKGTQHTLSLTVERLHEAELRQGGSWTASGSDPQTRPLTEEQHWKSLMSDTIPQLKRSAVVMASKKEEVTQERQQKRSCRSAQ